MLTILWASRFEYGPRLRHPNWWSTSDDGGVTWSAWSVFDPSDQHSCYYVTDAIHTSAGLLAGDATFPLSGKGSCHTRIHFSSDDGLTWSCRSKLTSPASNLGDEVALMETAADTVLCIQRDRALADTFRLWSRDGGRTWSDRESIRGMLDCVLQRPFLTRLNETSYLLSGRDYERKRVVTYVSTDGGRTFGHRRELDSFQKDGVRSSFSSTSRLTTCSGTRPWSTSTMLRAAIWAMRMRAVIVKEPECGVATTLSRATS